MGQAGYDMLRYLRAIQDETVHFFSAPFLACTYSPKSVLQQWAKTQSAPIFYPYEG